MEKIISNFICRNTRVQILTLTSLLFFTFLLGCNHANSDLQSKGVLIDNVANYALKEMIAQVLEYDGYNENLSCAIRVDNDGSYCVKIDQVIYSRENNKSFVYVTENGSEVFSSGEKESLNGVVKFFKFEILDHQFDNQALMTSNRSITNNLKLVAQSDLIRIGRCGDSCSGFTYKVGAGADLAWVVKTSAMHMCAVGEQVNMFAVIDGKIQSILNVVTYSSEIDGAFSDQNSLSKNLFSELRASIETVPDSNQLFYDLNVVIYGNKLAKNGSKKILVKKRIKFDLQKKEYNMDEINKIFHDAEK